MMFKDSTLTLAAVVPMRAEFKMFSKIQFLR